MRSPLKRTFCLALSLAFSATLFAQAPAAKPADKKDEPVDGITLPIKATQSVKFDVEEGTWMALDLSPDGKTIVFELLGDLYTIPATGGTAKLLVGGSSFECMPKFSPDGKKIVFISDRSGADNLWTVNADGTGIKSITEGRNTNWLSPSWTPDGRYVVASKSTGYLASYKLVMVDVKGGGGFPVGPKTGEGIRGANRMGIVSSPDGSAFYFAERRGPWTYEATFPMWQVYKYDRKTGETSLVTNAPGSAMHPSISPDGKTLYFFTRDRLQTGLRARELATGDERWVAYPLERDDQESRATRDTIAGYALTQDGKAMIASLGGKIQRIDLASGKTSVIPFKASIDQKVNPSVHFDRKVDEGMVHARIIRDPAISPDGKRVVFCALGKIWTSDLDGLKPSRLTDAPAGTIEQEPHWSPDGSQIAFTQWSNEGGELCVISPNGASEKTLVKGPLIASPAFTPDGKRIVFLTGAKSDAVDAIIRAQHPEEMQDEAGEIGGSPSPRPLDLKVVSVSGGDPTYIASGEGMGSLQFASDNDRLYYVRGSELQSIRLDGLDRKTHVRFSGRFVEGRKMDVDDIRVSPDGTQVLVAIDQKIYLSNLPQNGDAFDLDASGGGIPIKKLTNEGCEYLGWAPGGKSFFWALGRKLYRQDLEADKSTNVELKVEMARSKPTGTVALKGARLVTMRGDEVIERGTIVIKDNRIVLVGPEKEITIPKDATVIDVHGKTISPGYVDVHSHWFGNSDFGLPQSWGYLANLAYGVTTNRDPQSGSSYIYDYADLIDAGEAIGPRIYTTGPGFFSQFQGQSKDDIAAAMKKYKEAYETYYLKEYVTGDRQTRQLVAQTCQELGITPTTEGALEVKMALTEMADGFSGHEHALPLTPIYDDIAKFIAATHTFYTPTLIVTYGAPFGEGYWYTNANPVNDPKVNRFIPRRLLDGLIRRRKGWNLPEEYNFKAVAEGCAKVLKAGGKVCLGSHGEFQGMGAQWEIWMLQSGGMTPLQALRCATLNGAEAIGLAQDLGSLAPGKLADLIVYDKNPLENIRNTNTIHYVMRNGEMFEGDTMNEVYPVKKPLPKFYWNEDGPANTTTSK